MSRVSDNGANLINKRKNNLSIRVKADCSYSCKTIASNRVKHAENAICCTKKVYYAVMKNLTMHSIRISYFALAFIVQPLLDSNTVWSNISSSAFRNSVFSQLGLCIKWLIKEPKSIYKNVIGRSTLFTLFDFFSARLTYKFQNLSDITFRFVKNINCIMILVIFSYLLEDL